MLLFNFLWVINLGIIVKVYMSDLRRICDLIGWKIEKNKLKYKSKLSNLLFIESLTPFDCLFSS